MHALPDPPLHCADGQAQAHYRRLERHFQRTHAHSPYPAQLSISSGMADLAIDLAAHARQLIEEPPQGLYFHALSEAARYACNSHERAVVLQPLDFSVRFLRPSAGTQWYAHGVVVQRMTWQTLAQAELMDRSGRVIALGSGAFGRSAQLLDDAGG